MRLLYLKKEKGRKYNSENILPGLTHLSSGEPLLSGSFVSISDTKHYWAACIADRRIGLDIEETGRELSPKTVRALHQKEIEYLSGLEPLSSEWKAEFLHIWTAKESYMKYCGTGLRMGLSKFSVISADLEYEKTVCCKGYPAGQYLDIPAPRGLSVSLCIDSFDSCTSDDFSAAGKETETHPFRSEHAEDESLLPDCFEWEYLNYDAPFEICASEKAAGYLDKKNYSKSELRSKLIKDGYPEDDISNALILLSDRGYISDERYAEEFVRQSMNSGKGRLRIQRELKEKGISEDIASSALEAAAASGEYLSEFESALQLAEKTLGNAAPDEKMLAKIGRKLSLKGYESFIIYRVIEKIRK